MAASHAEATAFVSLIEGHPAITQNTAAPEYSSSLDVDGTPPLEPNATADKNYDVENEDDPYSNEQTEGENKADGDNSPLLKSPE